MSLKWYGPTRTCRDCGEVKPTQDFPFMNGAKGRAGYRITRCKPCWLKVRVGQYQRTDKARMFQWRYGITLAERDAMLAAQGGRCQTCRSDEHGGRDWCLDHDHACCPEKSRSCGKCIRGVLCFPCNVALGCVKDNPDVLRALIEYLAANQSNVSRRTPITG